MVASRGPDKEHDIEFTALEGSLSMMSKVLNDVLDFNRMDSGRFESVAKPYVFHKVMQSLIVPLRLATDARGLSLVTELDENIDEIARKALYQARGYNEDQVADMMSRRLEQDAVVVGDETRLRQILTNLARYACFFFVTSF
jgi:osomolarity two-component system, sensor histidine kinase SLN1